MNEKDSKAIHDLFYEFHNADFKRRRAAANSVKDSEGEGVEDDGER